MNDTLAFAAMKEIKKHHLRIPADIALIGYTDELHSNYVEPALTAVTHQTYKMGEECCNLLLKQIKKREKPRQIVVPTHLSIRETSVKKPGSVSRNPLALPELFQEYLAEIGGGVDSYQITYFANPVFAVQNQLACFFQTDEADEVVRRQAGEDFYLT